MNSTKKKIILIDGNSLVYRAFFALPTTLATTKGQITNAVYGFTSMLIKLVKDERPDILITAFDMGKATFRHEEYEEYKAHRQPTPNDLISQFPLVKQLLKAMDIPVFEMEGFEADDILATLASKAAEIHCEVVVVTGDRDAFQLIDRHVRIMTTRKGISDIVVYDREKVIEKYGVTPEQLTDYLALKGDPSDNIPGVPGIGEKTAAKLIQEFGTLENLLDNIDKVANNRWRNMLEENKEEARLSKRLATMDRDVPIEVDFSSYCMSDWDTEKVRNAFAELEFNSLLERLLGRKIHARSELLEADTSSAALDKSDKDKPGRDNYPKHKFTSKNVFRISDDQKLSELISKLKAMESGENFGVVVSTTGNSVIDQRITGIGVAYVAAANTAGAGDIHAYHFYEPPQMTLDFGDDMEEQSSHDINEIIKELKPYLESVNVAKCGHDVKRIELALLNEDIAPCGFEFDTMIAAYLMDPGRSKYLIEDLAEENLNLTMPEAATGERLAYEAAAVLQLSELQKENIVSDGLYKLFTEIEMPLIYILVEMEREGVSIDT
ncbi:MAG: hypothetical protein HY779_05585, partial [Rubrobacteridae bacterium]|nr:hypothetical protein [Rubrobacteridae bacterium]